MKEWVNGNIMKFIDGKSKAQYLGRNYHRHHPKQSYDQLESSFPEKDLVVLVDKLTMSQQPVLVVKKANSLLGCIGKTLPTYSGLKNPEEHWGAGTCSLPGPGPPEQKDKGQRAQTETQEAPYEYKEKLLEEAVQRCYGVTLFGDIQNLPGLNPVQSALGKPALSERFDQMISRGPFQPQPLHDSVIKYHIAQLGVICKFAKGVVNLFM
ncbi:hypothetical protein HGM15179_013523 [Zosterops borbonicus]|uniref:Uncharacterized protein n=1 Tax=Zosterops borbonicus TaxID=364589 RepID=A0A8K1G8X1_9PASS|nr:hypothetical protein HGM15179_013523 [Zosterops borbonicus]